MKLPNGYGSVYKLSGKRRKPWIARKTKGWIINDGKKIKQEYITIGYYETKTLALEALVNYNQNPYDIQANSITFSEVYTKWSEEHFKTIVSSAVRTWTSAYNHSAPLHNMRFKDLRPNHLEGCIQDAKVGQSTKQRMKSLYNLLFKYALKHDIVDKDYAALCNSVKRGEATIVRIPFSTEEITLLRDNISFPFVDMLLTGIYTGFRPQELTMIKLEDIRDNCIIGGLKTDAGKNRAIPIHPAIKHLINNRIKDALSLNSEYLFNDTASKDYIWLSYDKYRRRFEKIMKHFNLEHKPHDTRHTFITLGKENDMDEYILKLIAGHAINDITEHVYTHRTFEQLQSEINKIPDYINKAPE